MKRNENEPTPAARWNMARSIVLMLAVLIGVSPVWAQQEGRITGSVFNGVTGEPVRGATVTVVGLESSALTDLNGVFAIRVPAGSYQVQFSLAGYATETVGDVEVSGGAENNLATVMTPTGENADASAQRLSETVTVTASAIEATESALLLERKTADVISDNVSKEEMSRTASSSAAGVMQRVTGVTMVDNKYVYVRGLGERYSNTTMNGSVLPTTEPEKRVVPFDLFSSALLSKVNVLKSYTPDKPGDFGAGVVELETLDFPSNTTLSLSFGASYDDQTTGERFATYAGGLSFSGDGGIARPAGIPDAKLVRQGRFGGAGYTREELQNFGRSFAGAWQPSYETAPVGQNVSLTWGTTFGRLGVILSGNWSEDFDRQDDEFVAFYSVGGSDNGLVRRTSYTFDTSEQSVRRGLTANLAYRLSDNNNVALKAYSTRLSTSEHRFYEGFNEDANFNVFDDRLMYQDEEISTGQLSGDHFIQGFGPSGSLIEWRASVAQGVREENMRETLYEELVRGSGDYYLADESQSAFLLYNDLTDDTADAKADWTTFIASPRVNGQVKIGGSWLSRSREFDSRRFRFVPNPNADLDLRLPADQLLIPENITPGRFEIREETRTTDSYTGEHDVLAGYGMADLTMGRWRVVGGARFEASEQELVTFDQFDLNASPILTSRSDEDLLPVVSVVYLLNPATNLRAAYSRTINRPEFRELAPFEFTDVTGGNAVIGNPDLRQAEIDNFDLRYEWFPNAGEVVAASVFYKSFTNPIEVVVQATAQRRQSFENVESASNYGLELEYRRNLGHLAQVLSPFAISMNYTLVESEIEIGNPALSVLTETSRPLVGQADHVFNTTLDYELGRGTLLRALYNYSGEKIAQAGAYGLPDVIEQPRSIVDLVWLQDLDLLARGLSFKFSASNLLDEEREFLQMNEVTRRYKAGREYSFSIRYQPF